MIPFFRQPILQIGPIAIHAFGIAVAIAFIRGIAQREKDTLGNFWVDLVRATLWVLLPIAVVGSLFLVSQGVVQNLRPYDKVAVIDPQTVTTSGPDGKPQTTPEEARALDFDLGKQATCVAFAPDGRHMV